MLQGLHIGPKRRATKLNGLIGFLMDTEQNLCNAEQNLKWSEISMEANVKW